MMGMMGMTMNKTKWIQIALAALLLIMSSALAAQAQNVRSWVSGLGTDGNAPGCTQSSPCRTFNTAIANTSPGGQVVALDTAGYSGITNINKAITIEGAPGAHAFILVGAGTTGITVNGGSTDVIILRNIFVAPAPGAMSTTGLQHNGGKLKVQNCVFEGLTFGVSVTGSMGSPARMDLINCDLYGNGTAVLSNGQGANFSGNPTVVSQSMVVWPLELKRPTEVAVVIEPPV